MEDKSCGGCCCIEIPDDKKEDLVQLFHFRREVYNTHLAGKSKIKDYETQIATKEELLSVDTLEQTLEKKCHYLGFLDNEETKVGCLAHPEMNKGIDLRDYGFYKSAKKCQDFFCATAEVYEKFTPEQQRWFRISIRTLDWYDLSNQDKTYSMITRFREILPRIEEAVKANMEEKKTKMVLDELLKSDVKSVSRITASQK